MLVDHNLKLFLMGAFMIGSVDKGFVVRFIMKFNRLDNSDE